MSARTVVPCRADAERAAAALADVGVSRVVLFGSVARGGATERSDIDLAAMGLRFPAGGRLGGAHGKAKRGPSQ